MCVKIDMPNWVAHFDTLPLLLVPASYVTRAYMRFSVEFEIEMLPFAVGEIARIELATALILPVERARVFTLRTVFLEHHSH